MLINHPGEMARLFRGSKYHCQRKHTICENKSSCFKNHVPFFQRVEDKQPFSGYMLNITYKNKLRHPLHSDFSTGQHYPIFEKPLAPAAYLGEITSLPYKATHDILTELHNQGIIRFFIQQMSSSLYLPTLVEQSVNYHLETIDEYLILQVSV